MCVYVCESSPLQPLNGIRLKFGIEVAETIVKTKATFSLNFFWNNPGRESQYHADRATGTACLNQLYCKFFKAEPLNQWGQ